MEIIIEINKEAMSQLSLSDLFELRRDYQKELEGCRFAEDEEGYEVARRCNNILTNEIKDRKRNLFVF